MSEYMLILHFDEDVMEAADADGQAEIRKAHGDFIAAHQASIRSGAGLEHRRHGARIRPDKIDGGFISDSALTEAKEVVGGFYVIEAADLDAALKIAETVPMHGGTVEVRLVRPAL